MSCATRPPLAPAVSLESMTNTAEDRKVQYAQQLSAINLDYAKAITEISQKNCNWKPPRQPLPKRRNCPCSATYESRFCPVGLVSAVFALSGCSSTGSGRYAPDTRQGHSADCRYSRFHVDLVAAAPWGRWLYVVL